MQKWMTTLTLKRWGCDTSVEISIIFVTDTEMRKLNKQYRNKDKTTDVLSFPMNEEIKKGSHMNILGDIVISPTQARRDAKKRGISYEEELKFLLIHGFLHLLGYDHEISRKEELRMQKKEKEYLRYIKEN